MKRWLPWAVPISAVLALAGLSASSVSAEAIGLATAAGPAQASDISLTGELTQGGWARGLVPAGAGWGSGAGGAGRALFHCL